MGSLEDNILRCDVEDVFGSDDEDDHSMKKTCFRPVTDTSQKGSVPNNNVYCPSNLESAYVDYLEKKEMLDGNYTPQQMLREFKHADETLIRVVGLDKEPELHEIMNKRKEHLKKYHQLQLSNGNQIINCNFIEITEKNLIQILVNPTENYRDRTIFLHIYQSNNSFCSVINHHFSSLADDFPEMVFCRVLPHFLKMSQEFCDHAVPCIQMFYNAEMIASYIKPDLPFTEEVSREGMKIFLLTEKSIQESKMF